MGSLKTSEGVFHDRHFPRLGTKAFVGSSDVIRMSARDRAFFITTSACVDPRCPTPVMRSGRCHLLPPTEVPERQRICDHLRYRLFSSTGGPAIAPHEGRSAASYGPRFRCWQRKWKGIGEKVSTLHCNRLVLVCWRTKVSCWSPFQRLLPSLQFSG